MKIIPQDISNEWPIFCVLRMCSSEIEIEIEVGSPKIESLRKLQDQSIEIRLLRGITIYAQRIRNEEGEGNGLEEVAEQYFRLELEFLDG